MTNYKTGLVLEGGGMRGLYTIGVLDYFMDHGIKADYVIGVSAGACNGASFVSGQKGRSYRINTQYLKDKRYISLRNYIKTKSLFGMDFLFDTIPNRLDPYDYAGMFASECQFVVGVTNVCTGKPVYFTKNDMDHHAAVLRASSSIPVFSPIVDYQGGQYLDGGTSDPIPVKKALEDGCERVIVVLTRHWGYIKPKSMHRLLYRSVFRKYPQMVRLLEQRHEIYNYTLAYLDALKKQGKALVIAPSEPIEISRFETDIKKLDALYAMGQMDAAAIFKNFKEPTHAL